jgi:hypothetical protein
MDNPVNLQSRKAFGVFGSMVRGWSLLDEGETPYGFAKDGERTFVIGAEAFRAMLVKAGLKDGTPAPGGTPDPGADFWLRPGVAEIELLRRRPDRASFLMPEAEVMKEQKELAPGDIVAVPALYAEVGPGGPHAGNAPPVAAVDDKDGPSHYQVVMGHDPLRTFLDPYLAGYLCMQCK